MPVSLLVPVSVSAKVINGEKAVPSLGGTPFNLDAKLESGVHVHWALPDALTRARVPQNSQRTALFPGIPDYWLVVRLNPPPANPGNKHQRAWVAWVVDSRKEKATPLAQWNPDPVAASAPVYTVAGLLPAATSRNLPGWGVWTNDKPFDLANAAYYPSARNRFGFHDNLAGLQRTGKVTYLVVGWYANRAHDPLYNAADRKSLMREWKLAHTSHHFGKARERITNIARGTRAAATATATPAWRPAGFEVTENREPAPSALRKAVREDIGNASATMAAARLEKTSRAVPKVADSAADGVRLEMDMIAALMGPSEIVCHGAVVEVPLSGVADPGALNASQARVDPSMTRALAALAAANTSGDTLDHVEMMLDELEAQSASLSGVVDLPGAAHAKTFQAMPGKSSRYARLEVHPSQRGWIGASSFSLMTEDAVRGKYMGGNWPGIQQRAAYMKSSMQIERAKPKYVLDLANPQPQGPTDTQVNEWIGKLKDAMVEVKNAKSVDARLIRVQDYRKEAPLSTSGEALNRSGSDGAGYWLDLEDTETLKEFCRAAWNARIYLPDPDNVYELPGANWYRPWSPHVVMTGVQRSYRFGEDGRFDANGFLQCRASGDTLSGLRVSKSPSV